MLVDTNKTTVKCKVKLKIEASLFIYEKNGFYKYFRFESKQEGLLDFDLRERDSKKFEFFSSGRFESKREKVF